MASEISLVNIGPKGRRQRMTSAVTMALVVAAGLVFVAANEVDRLWRLLFFLPLFIGGLSLFQALAKT